MTERHVAVFSLLLCLCTARGASGDEKRVGFIAFFGQQGLNTAAIRNALPFREGSAVPFGGDDSNAEDMDKRWEQTVKEAVNRSIGREPTDVARLCCMSSGDLLVYIGLPGASFRAVRYNKAPKGTLRLPESLIRLDEEIDNLMFKAVLEGRAGEDDSEGYALAKDDPELRKKQLEFRDQARSSDALVFKVVESSSDSQQRAVGATALGYLGASNKQIASLVDASFDPDEGVRNNAVRALGVLLVAKPEAARQIPVKRFISLLSSGAWTDRNKGLMVILMLTRSRDPKLLRDLRSDALTPLIEAAQWERGHALGARAILGRIAGIDETKLWTLAEEEPPDTILRALGQTR